MVDNMIKNNHLQKIKDFLFDFPLGHTHERTHTHTKRLIESVHKIHEIVSHLVRVTNMMAEELLKICYTAEESMIG